MHKQDILTLNSMFLECIVWDRGEEEQYQENLTSLPLTVPAPRVGIIESAHLWNQMSTRLELSCLLLLFWSSQLEHRFQRQLFYSTREGKYEDTIPCSHSLLSDDCLLQKNN